MQKIGFKTDQIYSADEVKVVRAEVEGGAFPLGAKLITFVITFPLLHCFLNKMISCLDG